MVDAIIRVELFRHFVSPRHTAFIVERIRGNFALRYRKGQRESALKGDKLLSAHGHISQSGQLNALILRAVDYALARKIGCSCFFCHYYEARGPPRQDFVLKSCDEGGYAMWQRNNGQTEAEKLQNRFTAYLLVAVRRQQRDYMIKKNQQMRYELLAEEDTYQAEGWQEKDMLAELPLMMQLESAALQYALEQISERERYVFFARVLDGISFDMLGEELGLGYKGAAAVYYRAIGKIKKKMREASQNEF